MTKKKINIRKIMLQNKRVLASLMVVMILFFVLAFDLGVFAETVNRESDTVEMGGNGSYESGGTTIDVFNLEKVNDRYPVINSEIMRSYYTGSGQLLMGGSQNGSAIGINPASANWDWIFENTTSRGAFVPVSVSAGGVTQNDSLGAGYYVCGYAPGTASSQQYIYNSRFSGAGKMYLICDGDWVGVVSDQPIYYIWTRSMEYYGKVVTVCNGVMDSPNANGLYLCYAGFSSYMDVFFTDMPINLASSDGASGFTGLSDYNINGDNVNFNNLLRDNVVVDPSAPDVPAISDQSKVNLKFRDDAYYTGTGLNAFYHVNKFTFNEYQIDNPLQYKISTKYRIHFKNNLGVDTDYFYNPGDIELSNFLAQSSRLGQGNTLVVPLHSNFFLDSNGNRLTNAIISTINSVTGEDTQYINPNGIFENIIHFTNEIEDFLVDPGFSPGIPVVINRYDGVIEQFTIYSEITVYLKDDNAFSSFPYKDSHSFLDGKTEVISTDNTNSPYSAELPSVPSSGFASDNVSSGGISASGNSAVATIQKGAIQIVNTAGSSGKLPGFQISNQDWNEYGNLIESMNQDMRSITEEQNVSGVFAVIGNVYKVFPTKVWALITLGLAGSITITMWKKGTQCH